MMSFFRKRPKSSKPAVLFADAEELPVYSVDGVQDEMALFPMHVYSGILPAMVTIHLGSKNDPPVIATAGWWGAPGMNPEANAVRVSPQTMKELAPTSETPHIKAKIKKAGGWQILRHKKGFLLSVAATLVVALSAVALAIIGIVIEEEPFLWVAIAALLASVGECAKASVDIRGALFSRS